MVGVCGVARFFLMLFNATDRMGQDREPGLPVARLTLAWEKRGRWWHREAILQTVLPSRPRRVYRNGGRSAECREKTYLRGCSGGTTHGGVRAQWAMPAMQRGRITGMNCSNR